MNWRSTVRFQPSALPGNNPGQGVHTRASAASSIIWYRPKCRESEWQYTEEVWPTTNVTELCLHSLPAQGLETEISTVPTNYRVMREFSGPQNYMINIKKF